MLSAKIFLRIVNADLSCGVNEILCSVDW